MTEDERRNRNPAVEFTSYSRAEVEAKNPVVTAGELELHAVYVLQTDLSMATFNYAGKRLATNPVTLDAVIAHVFHAPRLGLNVYIAAKPDGTFTDAEGTRIVVRRWMGEDA